MATILVIDDDTQIRHMLRRALERQGHEILDAREGAEGLRLFREKRVDLVITDILMPEMEGLACIRELRLADPGIRVIAISGGGSQNFKLDVLGVARRLGATATLNKPFKLEELTQVVREELEHRKAA